MYKKPIIIIFALIAVILGISVGVYWQNLRGALPAIRKPSRDIAELIEKAATTTIGQMKPAENKTNMPLKFPDGFSISIFAKNLPGARVMRFDSFGNMWVSRTGEGAVALLEINDDGTINHQGDVLQNLRKPHGLAFDSDGKSNTVYIAEEHRVTLHRILGSGESGWNPIELVALPSGRGHFTRTIEFGPDGKLYISVGSSCNVCIEKDEKRASILRYDPENKKYEIFAKGLRNAVFFTWQPETKKIWVTEMGRDLLGDDIPPDEINIVEEGKNYGWPTCFGKNIHDIDFDPVRNSPPLGPSGAQSAGEVSNGVDQNTYIRNPCMEPFETPSFIDLQAHSAPLGLAFIPATADFPKEYWHDLLVAYHGSWNKTDPTGYKIVRFKLDENGNYLGADSTGSPQAEDFISGWLTSDGEVLGRPVDILIKDGAIYISDDKAGVIYKITHEK